MNNYISFLFVSICFVLFNSCGITQKTNSSKKNDVYELPDDLSAITSENLAPVTESLVSAKIIGVTECVHGMLEPFQFRNALIKELVESKRISTIAIESGLPESRIVYDYIQGKDIDKDSVFYDGFTYNFGTLEPNQELIIWLRNYNMGKAPSEQIHFYGFDIPGSPNNPTMENAMAGFNYVIDYLHEVDLNQSTSFRSAMEEYETYLRIKDNSQDTLPHFWDLDSTGWNELESILTEIENTFQQNSEHYIQNSSSLDYDWAYQSIRNARENVIFLRNLGKSKIDYDSRDFGQFKNIQWIIEQEENKNILLFAHSTHLMKEVHGDTSTFLPYPRCGEYLSEEYGEDYKVIGNFFRKLEWFDGDPLELDEGYLGYELSKIGTNNYLVDLNSLNENWKKEWCIRKTTSGNKLFTDLEKGVDIIYFNDTQTTLFPPENK